MTGQNMLKKGYKTLIELEKETTSLVEQFLNMYHFINSNRSKCVVYKGARLHLSAAVHKIQSYNNDIFEYASGDSTEEYVAEFIDKVDQVRSGLAYLKYECIYYVNKSIYEEAVAGLLSAHRRILNLQNIEGINQKEKMYKSTVEHYQDDIQKLEALRLKLSSGSFLTASEIEEFLLTRNTAEQMDKGIIKIFDEKTTVIGILEKTDIHNIQKADRSMNQNFYPEFKYPQTVTGEINHQINEEICYEHVQALTSLANLKAQLTEQCISEGARIFKGSYQPFFEEYKISIEEELKVLDSKIEHISNRLKDLWNGNSKTSTSILDIGLAEEERCKKSVMEVAAVSLTRFYTTVLRDTQKLFSNCLRVAENLLAEQESNADITSVVDETKNYLEARTQNLEKIVARTCKGELIIVIDIGDIKKYIEDAQARIRIFGKILN